MLANLAINRKDGQKIGFWLVPRPGAMLGLPPGVRFDTLEAICRALDCQPGDILKYREESA